MEEWKKSPIGLDHLEVSNLGRVRTLDRVAVSLRQGALNTQKRRGTIISPWIANNGYQTVSVRVGEKTYKFLVHRLVASVFVEGFDKNLTVNHKDGNKLNNLPSNLEWVTTQENTKHEWRTGLVDIRGEKHPSHILTNKDVTTILERNKRGETVAKIYKDYTHVSISLLYKIVSGVKRTSG